MITGDELRREIAALEGSEPSWTVLQRLASLYIIQQHQHPEHPTEPAYSRSSPPQTIVIPPTVQPVAETIPIDSEFARAAEGLTTAQLVSALDAHMETIRAIYPAEYRAVCQRVRAEKGVI